MSVVLLAGCDVDPGVDDVRYECTSSSQCGEGYECLSDPSIDREVCVPEGTSFDAGPDASDTADAEDPGGPMAIELNMGEPFSHSFKVPQLHPHPDGGVVLAGVFGSCLTFETGVECANAADRKLVAEPENGRDGFVARLLASGEAQTLDHFVGGTFALSTSLILAESEVLATGDWLIGGTTIQGGVEYGSTPVPQTDTDRNGFQLGHQSWLIQANATETRWAKRFGYDGDDFVLSLDVNGSDEFAVGGAFSERYYEPPQTTDGVFAAGDSDGYIEVYGADQAVESVVRVQSGSTVEVENVALADDGHIVAMGSFRDTIDVYYDAFGTTFSEFSSDPVLEGFEASDAGDLSPVRRKFLMSKGPGAATPVVHELGRDSRVKTWDADFDAEGAFVAVGGYWRSVNFGSGEVSASSGDGSFLTRWNTADITDASFEPETFISFDSPSDEDAFYSVAPGPNGGHLVAGQFGSSFDYKGTQIQGVSGIDGIVAEFDNAGQLIWHEVIGGPGTETCLDAAVMSDGRIAVLVELDQEIDVRGTLVGRDGEQTTYVLYLDAPTS
ncbi:MAG: hypothetical protein ACQEVA_17110 [Myxococcota bacterium]